MDGTTIRDDYRRATDRVIALLRRMPAAKRSETTMETTVMRQATSANLVMEWWVIRT